MIHVSGNREYVIQHIYGSSRQRPPHQYVVIDTRTLERTVIDYPSEYGYFDIAVGDQLGLFHNLIAEQRYFSSTIAPILNPQNALASISWRDDETELTGSAEHLALLPEFYIAPILRQQTVDQADIHGFIRASDNEMTPFAWAWFNNSNYDVGYQAPIDIAAHPITGEMLVSLQRAGHLAVCDPETLDRKRIIEFANQRGNIRIRFDNANNLWAMDRDVMVCIDMHDELPRHEKQIVNTRPYIRPEYPGGGAPFIAGDLYIDELNNVVWVTRPYDGDVLAYDMNSLQQVHQINTGGDPFDIAVVGQTVFTREWPTWELRMHSI